MTKDTLIKLIAHYDEQYYKDGASDISDAEYDILKEKLAAMGVDVDAAVPDAIDSSFEKVKHTQPILSLAKVTSRDNLIAEINRLSPVVIQPKIDGLTIVLYPNGRFVTRGRHGEIGEDVSKACRKALPQLQWVHPEFPVRMEVYMDIVTFGAVNRKREKLGLEKFENRRNAAAGIVRTKDVSKIEHLEYFAYNLVGDKRSETEQLKELNGMGFTTVTSWKLENESAENIADMIINFNESPNGRKVLGYDIDGMVIKSDLNDSFNHFGGATGHHPKNMIAFKWPHEVVQSTLQDIEWTVGRTGKITPVAIFKPITLGDASVSRATLHNPGIIEALELQNGATIGVTKANDIVPRIVSSTGGTGKVSIIDECPVCHHPLTYVEDQLYCTNDSCSAQLISTLIHAVSKDALDIDGLSKETIYKINKKYNIYKIGGMFLLTYEQLLDLPGFAEKSAKKLYDGIQSKRKVLLNKFIYAAGVPNVGRKASDDISAELCSYDAFIEDINSGCKRISKISGIGDVIIKSLTENIMIWIDLRKYIEPIDVVRIKPEGKVYTFVITGTLSNPRSFYEDIIKRSGNKVSGSVSSKTNYLLAGSDAGSKLEKAKSLGVKIIEESDLQHVIDSFNLKK